MKKPTNASRAAQSSPKLTKRDASTRSIELTDELRARIAQKAFEIFEQRGRQEGRDLEDWLEAEVMVIAELRAKRPR